MILILKMMIDDNYDDDDFVSSFNLPGKSWAVLDKIRVLTCAFGGLDDKNSAGLGPSGLSSARNRGLVNNSGASG